jgi:hypothetical protein
MRFPLDARRSLTALALLALAASAGLAAPEALAQESPAAIAEEQQTFWREKAAQVRADVVSAMQRQQEATAAYSRMLSRDYPKGEAKAVIIKEREDAAKAVTEARAAVGQFKEEARRASVPDRWIDPEGEAPAWWTDPDADS